MNEFESHSEESAVYTLETVEEITRISRDRIVFYYQHGLLTSVRTLGTENLLFDEQAIHQLRRIGFFLAEYGINQDGLKVIAALIQEVERLREEVRFLRER